MNIADIASEIYDEIGSPTDVVVSSIIYWLNNNIGTLNLLLDTEFVINSDNSTTPPITNIEKAILKLMYERYYFNKQLNLALTTSAYGSPGAINSVTEGNRSIKLNSGTEIAKSYRSVVGDINLSLNNLVLAYKQNGTVPLEVIYESYPPYFPCYGRILPPL